MDETDVAVIGAGRAGRISTPAVQMK